MLVIGVKKVIDCRRNTIYLCKGTNSHQTYTHSKKGKDFREPFPPFYYIENGMGKRWKWLAKIFAFLEKNEKSLPCQTRQA